MNNIKIKKFIANHNKINYIQRCIRNINNKDFVKEVLDINKNPMTIKIDSFGEKNRDKNIYLFENSDISSGFFAVYRSTLNALYFADRFNLIPVIDYTSDFIYAEEEEVNGSHNPFEYYFDRVSEINVDEARSSYNVFRYNLSHHKLAEQLKDEGGYTISKLYIDNMASIIKKYIHLNSAVEQIINSSIKNTLGDYKTLGVHVRGTDFNLKFNNHPIIITPEEYIEYVDKAMKEKKFDRIFLATDDKSALELFKEKYGEKVVYYNDTTRSDSNISVAFSKSERKNHRYLLGLEVLRDMYTLASCDGLIAGLSQVSICARITKVSFNQEYEYLEIVNKGTYNNFNTHSNYRNKIK